MSEIRFLTSSDEHVSDQPIGFRKDDYRSSIMEKLRWQGNMAAKFGATAILRGGDFFHVKRANNTSMATLIEAMSVHKSYPCPTYAIAGNHDIVYNDLTTLTRQPLGVLYESGMLKRLSEEIFESGSLSVRVVGVDYRPGMDADVLAKAVSQDNIKCTYTIAVVHALAELAPTQTMQSFFNENIIDYRDLVFPGCPNIYVFGHYHKDQSVQEHLGVHFINLGSVSRGSLTLENLDRKPKIALIKLTGSGISIEESVIPHADASQVFDLGRKQSIEHNTASMASFLDKLKSNVSMAGGNDIRLKMAAFMESMDFTNEEKSAVREMFEAAEAEQR